MVALAAVVKHAGVAGESTALNTRAFRILATTTLLSTPVTIATVTANTANQTTLSVDVDTGHIDRPPRRPI